MIYRYLAGWILAATVCALTGCTQEKASAGQPSGMQDFAQPIQAPVQNSESVPLVEAQKLQDNPEAKPVVEIDPDVSSDSLDVAEPATNHFDSVAQTGNFEDQKTLTDAQKASIRNILWDVDPEVLNAVKAENEGMHFLHSDERHPELFYDYIKDIGHTYIGIGTDQGYVFAGWQRPSLALMVDYDPWVVMLHKIYFELFKECDDADCLMSYFDNRDKGMSFVKERFDNKMAMTVYKEGHRGITYALRAIRRMKQKTFMNDPETYRFIKQMIIDGRMTTVQANLLGDKAFDSIQSSLKSIGASVGVLYLSNAENYWAYTQQYKENMLNLPYSDNALIIRTIATKPFNQDYRYSVQKAEVFKAWLEHPETKSVKSIVGRTKIKDEEDIPITVDNKMPK